MLLDTLHPKLVHFPIALLIVALLFDLAALVFPRAELTRASLYVSAIAALGAVAAYLAGNAAEESVEHLPGIEALLERHEDLGKVLMVAAIAGAGVRLLFFVRRWHEKTAGRAVLSVVGGLLAALVAVTGYTGGQLVYEHGAGVAPVMQRQGGDRPEGESIAP